MEAEADTPMQKSSLSLKCRSSFLVTLKDLPLIDLLTARKLVSDVSLG